MKKRNKLVFFLLFFLCIGVLNAKAVYAATDSVSIDEIDYDKGTMTILANQEDTKVFFANKENTTVWDEVIGELDAGKKIVMDITWASRTKDVVFHIKGDASEKPVKVTLPKQSSTFKVSLNTATSEVTFSNTGGATHVYWRKSTSSYWNELALSNLNDFKDEIERFSLQGITLYFRTGQVKGSSESAGARPSKEAVLKIAKRATAPSVKVDFSKFTISVKNTMEYKKSTENGWTKIEGSVLNFNEAALEALYNKGTLEETEEGIAFYSNEATQEVFLDFRIKATQTKVASRITTVKIPAQEKTEDSNVIIQYVGSTQLRILIDNVKDDNGNSIKGASTANPYEYTVVTSDKTYNVSTAVWTAITTTSVAVTSTQAPEGSKIYIRKKATADALATEPLERAIGAYPTASSLKEPIELTKTRGVEGNLNPFLIKVPNKDTTISSITFAGKVVKFTASPVDDNNLVTVTITDVSAVESVSNISKWLEAVIILNNGDKIEKGVTLWISPSASLKSKSVQSFAGIEIEEDLKLELELGVDDKKVVTGVTVTEIKISDTILKLEDGDFTVVNLTKEEESTAEEDSVEGDSDSNNHKIIIIEKAVLNKYVKGVKPTQIGTAIPIIVKLSNGEEIKTGVTITTKAVATITSSTAGIGISASSSSFTNPTLTLTIDSTLFATDNSFMVTQVMWEGTNILETFGINEKGNIFTIVLSLDKVVNAFKELTSSTSQDYCSSTVQVGLLIKPKNAEPVLLDSAFKITVVK